VTRLVCPFCGPRHLREFEFHKTVPGPDAGAFARVYERVDSTELSVEHWQHVGGCRGWLQIRRNPSTGTVLAIHLVGGGGTA
jgi:heterotetrameric sarcosine oxidase delta subunit